MVNVTVEGLEGEDNNEIGGHPGEAGGGDVDFAG
jgi:hypothetical protein